MENEIWKDVIAYEGLYQVSNLGNVKSLRFNKEKILKQRIGTKGYFAVCLRKDKIVKTKEVHQLIAIAFLNHKPCGYKLVINHIDFNQKNNNIKNLQIVTHRENTNRKHIQSSSKYVGVYWGKNDKKWKSAIRINGKKKHLGSFINEYDAHLAYQNAVNKI